MPKKQASQDRKARIAEMQKIEKARENRVRLRIIAGSVALLLVLTGVITYAVFDARRSQPDVAISSIGVPASAASCDAVTNDKAGGNGNHVGPNTSTTNTKKVKYSTVPPSNGPHFAEPVASDVRFYAAADRPPMEDLVHNLEHGYTVLWYDEKAGNTKKAELEELAKVANKTEWASGKFIISPWDPSYGELAAGKKFALSHWSATLGPDGTEVVSQAGHRQLCGDISGAVVKAFIQQFPRTSAPEPGAA
ncbi:MAG: DUF3105 domain-containing protein [Gammaproteobacteria bacterium]